MSERLHNIYYKRDAELPTCQVGEGGCLVARTCEQCGGGFVVERRRIVPGRARFCSVPCARRFGRLQENARVGNRAQDNPNWRGGISQDHYRYTLRFRERHPEKHRAQQLVAQAVASGRLIRPEACSACGLPCVPHGHHDDYSQPLAVRWLCRTHHRVADIARRKLNDARPMFRKVSGL